MRTGPFLCSAVQGRCAPQCMQRRKALGAACAPHSLPGDERGDDALAPPGGCPLTNPTTPHRVHTHTSPMQRRTHRCPRGAPG